MRKAIVCIFAHPDDESFGPGGTIAKYSKNHDVFILCATKGELGGNNRIREKELLNSAKILGVKKVIFLGFRDGSLCNETYHDIAARIKKEILKIKPEILLTFEPKGVSGHLDHIAISMITTYVFRHVSFTKTLLYYCNDEERTKRELERMGDYFVYFPKGYKPSEIDKVIDISSVWDKKVKAIRSHQSQTHDIEMILPVLEKLPKEEHFLVLKK